MSAAAIGSSPVDDTQWDTYVEGIYSQADACEQFPVWAHEQSLLLTRHSFEQNRSSLQFLGNTWHTIVKYSSGNTMYNGLSMLEFYNTNNYTASFPEDNCSVDPAEKCNRPCKHSMQLELMSGYAVKQVSEL